MLLKDLLDCKKFVIRIKTINLEMQFSFQIKSDDLSFLKVKTTKCTLTVQAFSQSVPARVGAWWGGWWGQGDCGRGLHWVIHGQYQAGAPDCHLMFC